MGVYTIYLDGKLLYRSDVMSTDHALTDLNCTLTLGEEGSASFTVPPTNVLHPDIFRMKSRVLFYENDELIFSGRVTDVDTDMDLQKKVDCEGDLALLLDSLHGPYKGTCTVRTFIQNAIRSHNAQVDDWKQFAVGNITMANADSSYAFDISGYSSTKEILSGQLVDVFGGYFQTRLGTTTTGKTPKGGEAFTTTLSGGSRGTKVRTMQSRLNERGYNCGSVDGIFGSNTRAGVKSFQQAMGIEVTGVYDKTTHETLMGEIHGWNETETREVILLDYLEDPYLTTQAESTSITYEDTWNAATDKLKSGSTGSKVRQLQQRLISIYGANAVGSMGADGIFGNYTAACVARFRADSQWGADKVLPKGYIYDKETHDKLMVALGLAPDPSQGQEETTEIVADNLQRIHFGVNLIEMSGEYPISDIFTVLLPLGANDITIAQANDGNIYLENAAAINEFGRIVKSFTWSKATTAQALKAYAEEYLKSHTMVFPDNLTITALDLHLLDDHEEKLKLGDWVSVVSDPHKLDQVLCVLEIDLDMQSPENTQYKLGYYIPANFDSDTSEKNPSGGPSKNTTKNKNLSTSVASSSNTTSLFDQAVEALGGKESLEGKVLTWGVNKYKEATGG